MTDTEKLDAFLETQHHMVVSVVTTDGKPWVVPVGISRREGAKIFEWRSRLETVHSKALEQNAQAAITIFRLSYDEWKEFGFYATGTVTHDAPDESGFANYRLVTDKAWINDENHVKREVKL